MMWPTMKYLFALVNELYVIKVMFLEGKRKKQISNWRVGHLNFEDLEVMLLLEIRWFRKMLSN